jgi:hypothetical protein
MEILAAVVVVATLAAMASGKVPAVLALATGLAVGGILTLAPVPALFAGLSNGGVIAVAGVLVIAKGVVKTGVIARATWWLLATVTTAAQALRRLIVPVGVASALMNTTPLSPCSSRPHASCSRPGTSRRGRCCCRSLMRPRWPDPSRSSAPARTC